MRTRFATLALTEILAQNSSVHLHYCCYKSSRHKRTRAAERRVFNDEIRLTRFPPRRRAALETCQSFYCR